MAAGKHRQKNGREEALGSLKRAADEQTQRAFAEAMGFVKSARDVKYFRQLGRWNPGWRNGTEEDSWTAAFTYATRKLVRERIRGRQSGGTYSDFHLDSDGTAIVQLKSLANMVGRSKEAKAIERELGRVVGEAARAQNFEGRFLGMTDNVKRRIRDDALSVALCLLLSDQAHKSTESFHVASRSVGELKQDSDMAWEPWKNGYGNAGRIGGEVYPFREVQAYERDVKGTIRREEMKNVWIARGRHDKV